MEDNIDKNLFEILHPMRFTDNFPCLESFEKYIRDVFASSSQLLFVPTLRKVLKAYENYEGYEQCIILKNIIDEIKDKQKIKK